MHSQFAAIVAIAILAVSPSAYAVGCFSGGQTGDCSGMINNICNRVNGVLFGAGQVISTCTNFNGYCCNMAVYNTGRGGSGIGFQQCIDDMTATNNGCQLHSGIRADGNFQLTLDPNAGAC